ncbi:nucleoside monophosphate kinase [bacterium]|nr:nucleoside monophosphate kinase [bacterium]
MHLILIGPPGSGKGTQAKKIAKEFHLDHISTGDLLRNNPDLTKEQKELLNSGKLIPDMMMLDIVKARLNKCHGRGWILDGYPRTIAQAHLLENALEDGTVKVLYFTLDTKELVDRITGRLSCPACGSVFHKITRPPKKDNLCDNCGEPLIHRKDDTEEVIKKRLDTYFTYTDPVVKYYQDKNRFYNIACGNKHSIDEIFETIKDKL